MVKTVDDLADAQLNLTKVTKVKVRFLKTPVQFSAELGRIPKLYN